MENIFADRQDVINETVHSLVDCFQENYNVTNKFRPSIHIAPDTLRDVSRISFIPRVVSIGLIHHGDLNLQAFEVQKVAFVRDLLMSRSESSTQTLTTCVEKVASMTDEIKRWYDKTYVDDSTLAKVMVMDACFILYFIHLSSPELFYFRLQDQYNITSDLLLLENQIPFVVLEGIYECIKDTFAGSLPITEFILPFLKRIDPFQGRINVPEVSKYPDHILGYLHHCYQPRVEIKSGFPNTLIESVVELDMAGVSFKPCHDPEWALAMKVKWNRSRIFWFWFKPTLTMPKFRIHGLTELVLWNLIAYERHVGNFYVTSYAGAMGMLIDTHEDIATLVRSNVIVNQIGSNKEAAQMIKNIWKQLAMEKFYYPGEMMALDSHFNSKRTKSIMKLNRAYFDFKKTYFNSPWTAIALFAGIALFVLTFLQTVYTIKSSTH